MKIVKNKIPVIIITLLFSALILPFTSCSDDDIVVGDEVIVESITGKEIVTDTETSVDDTDFEATNWTAETLSKGADPNFNEIFEDNTVKRLDLVITEARWQSMLDDMTYLKLYTMPS
jgi:spore coat protein H